MRNIAYLSSLGVVFAFLLLGCGGKNNVGDGPVAPTKAENRVQSEVAVDAEFLTNVYDENEVAADGKYKNRVIAVTGQISSIAETLGNITVHLKGHNSAASVVCSFLKSERENVSRLRKGGYTKLVGTVEGSTAGLYVGLTNCWVL